MLLSLGLCFLFPLLMFSCRLYIALYLVTHFPYNKVLDLKGMHIDHVELKQFCNTIDLCSPNRVNQG